MDYDLHLRPQISAEEAWKMFRTPRWRLPFVPSENAPLAFRGAGDLPCLERLWLPFYFGDYTVRGMKRGDTLTATLDACGGSFAVFHAHAVIETGPPPADHWLPALIAAPEAERQLNGRLTAGLHYQRGALRGIEVVDGPRMKLVAWPLWLYYFRRGKQAIDFRLLDAVIGDRPGTQTKAGIMRALTTKTGNA